MKSLNVRGRSVIPKQESSDSEPRRALHVRHTSEKTPTVSRVLRVPVRQLPDEQWRVVRRLAYKTAQFGNVLLSEQYTKAKGFDGKFRTYTDFNTELSSAVRDAVGREVIGIWRREGRKVLRGEQTLGRFGANRALVVRDVGVKLVQWGGGNLAIHLRLEPKPAEPFTFALDMHAIRHWKHKYLSQSLERLVNKEQRITKASVVFEKLTKKIALFLTYDKVLAPATASHTRTATFSVLGDGTCKLQSQGNVLTLSDRIYRLMFMKEHFGKIHERIRASLGKVGRWRDNRKALLKAGSFEVWAQGPVHQLSRQIVNWCQANNVGTLTWQIEDNAPSLPWHELQKQVEYKASEIGIVSQIPSVTPQKKSLRKDDSTDTKKNE